MRKKASVFIFLKFLEKKRFLESLNIYFETYIVPSTKVTVRQIL